MVADIFGWVVVDGLGGCGWFQVVLGSFRWFRVVSAGLLF